MMSLLIAKSAVHVTKLHRDWPLVMMHILGIFVALSDVNPSTWLALLEAHVLRLTSVVTTRR